MGKSISRGLFVLFACLLGSGAALAQQAEVAHTEDFQSYGTQANPPGWVDTSVGTSKPIAGGLYKTWPDPLQGNSGTNVVFGTKQSSGQPEGNNPRIGTFSTLTTKSFPGKGRFEYRGRFIRTSLDSRIGFTFFSSYPEKDAYYLIGLWQGASPTLTMQLFGFGAGTLTKTTDSKFTPEPNKWHRFLIQVDDLNGETRIRAKFWLDGAVEPTTFSIDAVDAAATRLVQGRIGIWAAVKGDAYVDNLSAKSPVDHTAPVIKILESGNVLDPAIITPISHDAILEATAADDISGVASLPMKVDNVDYTPRTPVTVEGVHTVRADAEDKVGNKSFLEAKILIDKSKPVVVFSDGTRTLDPSKLETFTINPTIHITVTDAVSKVSWAATKDGQPFTSGSAITVDGFYKIRVVAVDEANNVTDLTLNVLVDKIAPAVVFSESGRVLDQSKVEPFKVDPKIDIKVTDATSKVTWTATIGTQTYVPGTAITVDNFYDIRVVARDEAGNTTDVTQKILVDKVAPIVVLSENNTVLDPAAGTHEFDHDAAIDIKVTDATSKARYVATLDGNPYVTGTKITVDGFHELQVSAEDEAGNVTNVTLKILVDKKPPVVVFTESGIVLDPAEPHEFSRDAKVLIEVTDATSKPTWTTTLDGGTYEGVISAEGFHQLRVVAKDESGNVTDVTLKVLIDKGKPTIELFDHGKTLDPAVLQKYQADAVIDIVVKDAVSKPTYTATLTTDGQTQTYITGTSITVEKRHKLAVNAIDEAGNTAHVELELQVDKTRPVVKFYESGKLLDQTQTTRFAADIHIDIEVTDNLPGVTWTAKIDGGDSYASGALIHADGLHTVTVHAVDFVGNVTDARVEVLVDQTGPVIEFRHGTTKLPTDVRQDFKELPSISIDVTDALTKPTYTATIDDGKTFTTGDTVAEGYHVINVAAKDELENKSAAKLDMLVDKTAPVVTLRVGNEPLPDSGKIFAEDIRVVADIVDISKTTVAATLNGKVFSLDDLISEEREHELVVTVTDELKWPTTKTARFFVDKTAPKISVFESAGGTPAPLLDESPFAREIVITATADDLTPYTLTATIDNQAYVLGTPYAVDGPHTLVVNGVDAAKNVSEPVTIKFYIDKSAPEVTLLETGNSFPVAETFTRDVVATVKIVSATETTTVATIDGQPYTLGQPYAPEGHHEIVVTVTNKAGLPATVKAAFTIDKTNPTIQLFADDKLWTAEMDKFAADVKVTVKAQDNLDTDPKITILLDEQEIKDGYLVTREDFHKIVATVEDDGGLPGQSGPFEFVLDKSDPEVTVTVDGKPLESGAKFNKAIAVKIEAKDLTKTTITATLNDKPFTPGATIEEDAFYSLVVSVKDDLGNDTTLAPITFVVDKTAPIVVVKERDARFEGGKFDRNVTPVVEIQDLTPTSTIATLDDETWTSGKEIDEEGDHVLKVTVTDDLEWVTVVPPIEFTVDKSAPVVEITERGEPLLDNRIFNRDAQPKIKVTDTTATELTATLDGQPFTSETLVTAEKEHVLKVSAVDALGHVTDVPAIRFVVDKTPPLLTLTENGQLLVNGAILNHDVKPELAISDLTATDTVITLDGTPFTLGTTITAEGPHVLDITVTDKALWKSTISNLGFFIDKTAPVVNISVDGKPLESGNEFGAAVTPKIDVTDISATTIAATLDGAEYRPGTPVSAEGPHTLVVTVTDAAKWVKAVPPITFMIDMSPPVVQVLEDGKPFETGTKLNRNAEPKIVVSDLTRTTIDAKLDGAAWTPDTVISVEGDHVLAVSVTDNLAHSTPVPPIAFTVDKTAPVVSIVANGKPLENGNAFLGKVRPEILVTDVTKTIVDAKLNGQPFVSGLEITTEGKYTLTVTVTDEVGWSTTVPPIEFFVDATAPVVKLVDQHDEELVSDTWYAEPVTPRAVVTDTTPYQVTATLNGQSYQVGTEIATQGTYTLIVKVEDQVGLVTEVPAVTFHIDTTAPNVVFTSPLANSIVATPEVIVTGQSDDAISLYVNGVEAEIDAAAKTFVTPPIPLLEGANVISALAFDRAGNKAEPSMTVTLDTRAPELSVTAPAENACLNVNELEVKGTTLGGAKSVKIAAGNAGPIEASLSGNDWTARVATPSEGKLVLTVTATDESGHATNVVRNVTIDRSKPVVSVTENGAPFTATLVNRAVTLTVTTADADPNATLTVTLNDAPFAAGTTIANDGTYTLKAKATDCAGLVSDEKVVTFRVDRTPPVVTNLAPAHGANVGNKPAITGTVSEPATLVVEGTAVSANVAGNFSINVPLAEGLNQFVYLVTDQAGNQSRVPHAFTVKSNAPAVEILENGAPIPANALFNRNVTPVIRTTESDATITATADGAPFTSGTAITTDGPHTVTAKATDKFGHESATATATFRIDKTPPTITITEPANNAALPSNAVTVRGDVSADAKSVNVNGISASVSGGKFTASITLDGAEDVITAVAVDEAGNSASDSVTVTVEGGALALIVTSPGDKDRTNRPTTVVAGQVLTPSEAESLTINGTAASFDASGAFLIPDFALQEGVNVITVTVKKKGGASNSVVVSVTADFTPPVLKVLADSKELANGDRFTDSPSIVLEATDANPGVVTTLTIDGTTITGAVGTLEPGGHSLTAIATDSFGNKTRVDRTFFVGASGAATGCGLGNVDPVQDTSVFDATIKINGRAGGAQTVLINGTRAEVADGSFCGNASLNPGRNEVVIQCADAQGNPTSDPPLRLIVYRYLDPAITITTPTAGDVVTPKVTVTGTVGAGVVEGNVNGVKFTVADDGAPSHTFTVADVPLTPGLNVIAARAETKSHRGGVATVRVNLTAGVPQIAITSPLSGSSTGATSIDVTGTYANVDPSTIAVNGASATTHRLSDTTGTFSVSSVNLTAGGKITITATGRNTAQVQASSAVEIEQVSTAPQITITAPADNTFLPSTSTGKITVTGRVANAENAAVQVNGNAATLSGNDFSIEVDQNTSAGGSTPIVARVTLPDGRTATDAVRVVRFAAPLSVGEAFPAVNAVAIDPAVVVIARLSNPLDASTVDGAFKVVDSTNTPVAGEVFVDREVISFAPSQALKAGERYTISIAQTLKDAAGGALDAAFSSSFTVGGTAPDVAPVVDQTNVNGCFSDYTITGRATIPGARIQVEVDGVKVTKTSHATTGAFEIRFTLSGQPGYHAVRVREVGADGTLSPERALCFRISCAAARVVTASLDRPAKKLVIQFSKPMDPATLAVGATASIRIVPDGASALTGTVAMNAANDTATVSINESLPESPITLTVTRDARDSSGAALAAEYTQVFTLTGAPPSASGKGYISGAVYDATRGRPLSAAQISISGEVPATTDDRGRYTSRPLGEGAYTIRASADKRTTVWRQVVVPVGSGVLPIDIRLTERGPSATANGSAQTLTHGADTTITRKVDLAITAASLPNGKKLTLTSVGAQSLAGLLPLGWSPLAAAEIVVDDSTDITPLPGAKLTFHVDAAKVTAAAQTLSIVQYDSERDEWRVAVPAANVASDGKVSIDLTASGNYALVYPDQASHLAKPSTARAGAILGGVANPCLTTPEVCLLRKIDFKLDPPSVLPNGRTAATLTTEGAAATQTYPSGTAVQAYIDEQLNLADGRVLVDPPFATDLLVYRDLAGTTGVADFHLAPTPQAAAVMLRDGVDHIRIVDYPGRVDRGTLIGADGGRVPGDDAVTLDIPTGATAEPLHASVSSMSANELATFGSVAGFRVAGGFTFSLTRTTEPAPVEGTEVRSPVLLKSARATFSVSPIPGAQVIVAEVVASTPFGVTLRMVAATTASTTVDVPGTRVFTTREAGGAVPIDGIVRDGRYLILASEQPIAYAYGQVRAGSATGLAAANARVTSGIGSPMTATLGVTDVTRTGGVFVVPVASKPAPAYSLQPRSLATGDGSVAVATASPDADKFVDFGTLVLAAQAPQLLSVTPDGSVELDVKDPFAPNAVFNVAIDPASVAGGLVIRNQSTGATLPGTVTASGSTVRFAPAGPLHADTRYSITVAPTLRSLTGTPFGQTVTKNFRTLAVSENDKLEPGLISITMPDANGRSTISGRPGALPTGSQAIAVRRGRFFIRSYETTVTKTDGSFSFDAGYDDPKDRISLDDQIDLRVLDKVSNSVIAVIPLTPFVSADGKAFLAPVSEQPVRFTSADGITLTVQPGTFDKPTMVRVVTSDSQPFTAVPQFSSEMAFTAGTRIEFDGVAKKRIEVEIPVPAGFVPPAGKDLMLGWLGNSIRGPRVEIVDTLRIAGGKFTTTEEAAGNARFQPATNSVLTGREVKKYLLGVLRSGIYAVVHVTIPIPGAWSILSGLESGVDFFWNHYASLFASDFYLHEGRGRIAIPVLLSTPFKVEGVDSATGFTVFAKEFPNADAGLFENVNPDVTGPYPVFVSPGRVETVDLDLDLTRVRNFEVKKETGPSATPLAPPVTTGATIGWNTTEALELRAPKDAKMQALVPARGSSSVPVSVSGNDGVFNIGTLNAKEGDRVILIAGEKDVPSETEITLVFNEPITVPATVEELRKLILLDAYTDNGKIELSGQAEYDVDSNGRRFRIAMPSGHLIRGARYELTLKSNITDASGNRLGQGIQVNPSTGLSAPAGGYQDVIVSFEIREPHDDIGDFNLEPSTVYTSASLRDMAQYGNLLFVSSLDGGILAYDMANPAGLDALPGGAQPKPFAFVPGQWNWSDSGGPQSTPGFEQNWAVATDHHGRVFGTGFTNMFGAIRSFRAEDFVKARTSPMCTQATTTLPKALCTFHGAAVTGWRPGYSSALDLASGVVLSDRVEATPRKVQILLQDTEEDYAELEDFRTALGPSVIATYDTDGDGDADFEKLDVKFTFNPDTSVPYYLHQRVTVENVTRNLRWSADVPKLACADPSSDPSQCGLVKGIIAAADDKIRVYRNERTYAVISQFGHGVGVFDMNAIESNDEAKKPSGWKLLREQIIATRADEDAACNLISVGNGITDLAFSPEAAVVPSADPSQLVAFAPEVRKGVLGIGVPIDYATGVAGTTSECVFRDGGMLLGNHPRLQQIKDAFTAAGRTAVPRYQSVSYYRGDLYGNPADYILVAANDLGLLAINVGPDATPYLSDTDLAGAIWVPNGVVAVRTIPRSHLATLVDKRGYVYIADLSKIDERLDPITGALTTGLFATTTRAVTGIGVSGEVGIPDSRIIWRSTEPLVTGTMAPIFDPDTGFLIAGETMGKRMRVVPAIDPRVRMMIRAGGEMKEVEGVTPLGINPREGLIDTGDLNASAGAFRLEVSLPAGAAKALEDAGSSLQLAVESEFMPLFDTAQTPVSYPKAHLREKKRDGSGEDPDRTTKFVLHRDLPEAVEEEVRLQKGATRYVSDWIVAIADPRASEKWKWADAADVVPSDNDADITTKTAERAKAGCESCTRPKHLLGKKETDGVHELWSAGRFITVRADGAVAASILDGTPYEYLGEDGRLTGRFTTIRGRKVRPTEVLVPAHNPPVAEGMLQETHYMHSGEVETAAADLNAGGRAGVNVVIARTYRSRTIGGTEIGEGWDAGMYRFLLQLPNGHVEYHDGAGEIWRYTLDAGGAYVPPPGLFLRLIRTQRGWTMLDQQWRIAEFNDLGQLIRESDEFYDPTRPGSGNTIRYVYDQQGRLERILDPFGRPTILEYDADSGRLKAARTEWRNRSVEYEHDEYGRLERVKLPEFTKFADPLVPGDYGHTGGNRPVVEYGYQPVTSVPVPDEPLRSQVYTDFAELAGDLTSIKDPEQVKNSGPARVEFTYDTTVGPNRDRNTRQKWANTVPEAEFGTDFNVDVLGQRRTYTLTAATDHDKRRHFLSKTLENVPVIHTAEDELPGTDVGVSENAADAPLTTSFTYEEDGLELTRTQADGLVVTNHWIAAAGAPGKVLEWTREKAPAPLSALIETRYQFDSAAQATANVSGVGRSTTAGGPYTFRSNETPSRNHKTIQSTDVNVTSKMAYDDNGQMHSAETTDGGGGGGMQAEIDYYPESSSNPIESGRPHWVRRGGGSIVFESKYALSGDQEVETTTDIIRAVTTKITKDVEGRVIAREVTGGGLSTRELFGYNADGKLAWQARKQTGIPSGGASGGAPDHVVTTTRYDALGRITGTSTFGARVLADPSSPASDTFVALDTKTAYNLGSREITDFDAHRPGEDGVAPRTVRKLDKLGRTSETVRTGGGSASPSGGSSIRTVSLYDIHGLLAYTTDRKRTASITHHDHFGRPVATMLGDGTRADVHFNEWDEVVETIGFEARTSSTDPFVEVARSRNTYTSEGRLRLSVDKVDPSGRSRATAFTWEQGDTITTNRVGELAFGDPGFGSTSSVRVTQTTRDSAGRVTSEISGSATGPTDLVADPNVFSETRVTEYFGDLAKKRVVREPRAGRMTQLRTEFDGLGRPTDSYEGGGALATHMGYDEAGNMRTLFTPGIPTPAFMDYDARGLMWREQQPTGETIHRGYDERGTLRQYLDESTPANVTFYDADPLGRVWKIRYPGNTDEESRFEEGTGVLLASRDRAKQWIWFEYDQDNNGRLKAEHLGGFGAEPDYSGPEFTHYTYDKAGRVVRIANADAAVEFDAFDLLGRPTITRNIRYRKTGCLPAIDPCGSGLTASPQVAEVYTQGHQYSVLEDERSRWRMPVVGNALPADAAEVDTPWRNWIEEARDGGANVIRQGEALNRTASAATLLEAQARGMGRLAERKRAAGGASLVTNFGYADVDDPDVTGAPVVPVFPASPGAPTGMLGRHEVSNGLAVVAGTEVTNSPKNRPMLAEDLSLADRESTFDYDNRLRLAKTMLLRREDPSAPNQPSVENDVQPAGFLKTRVVDPARMALIGTAAQPIIPLTWIAANPNAAGQIESRIFPGTTASQSFGWDGARRASDGTWTLTYDARGRMLVAESADRRLRYDYDPNDRLVGRLAQQKDAGGAWTLETRANVLARDGLPASATFVWDSIVDRMVAVYDSTVVSSTATPAVETGLVRQYIHGDQAYDDPVEVLIADEAGLAPKRFLPIVDEAGTGSLQAVTDGDGNLVERVLYADAYGDAPRYLQGAVVERIERQTTGDTRTFTMTFSEPFEGTTVPAAVSLVSLAADGSVVQTLTPSVNGDRAAKWSLSGAEWSSFTAGASSVQFRVSADLRFKGWGTTPLQPAAQWEALLGRANYSLDHPFLKTIQVGDSATLIYDLPDLYLAGRVDSISKLNFDFHTLPLRDPATNLVYVRARWYDSSTGSFLSPDPMGYEDASNLYAYAGNDPVTMRDPRGEFVGVDNAIGGIVSVGLGWGIAKLTGQEYTPTDALIDFTVGFATTGISAINKFGKLGKVGLAVMKEGMEFGVDVAAAEVRAYAKGEDFSFKQVAFDTAKNALIGKIGAVVGKRIGKAIFGRSAQKVEKQIVPEVAEALEAKPAAKMLGEAAEETAEDTAQKIAQVAKQPGVVKGMRQRGAFTGLNQTGQTAGGANRATSQWRRRYGPAANRRHHLAPQELLKQPSFVQRMSTLGFTKAEMKRYLDQQIVDIPNLQHNQIHSEGWNEVWMEWLQRNPNFGLRDIQNQIKSMMTEFGIAKGTRGGRMYGRR